MFSSFVGVNRMRNVLEYINSKHLLNMLISMSVEEKEALEELYLMHQLSAGRRER
jgi:hypothetical protein